MVERYVRSIGLDKEIYVLKIDISKYFYNIDHEILFSMIKKRIKDEKALDIILQIISLTDYDYINERIKELVNNEIKRIKKLKISNKEKMKKIKELNSIPLYEKGRGASIGCLSNQMLALFYLNEVDHFIKEKLKHKYYVRYCDDLCIFDTDKEKLKKSFILIEEELNKLKLKINNKSGIYRLKEGISFLGYTYQLKNNKLLIKYTNTTIRKINRKLRKSYNDDFDFYYRNINSYKGYFKKCNTNLYYDKYKKIEINSLFDKYKMLKGRYKDRVVFIKYKNRYYTYLEDLKEVNRILGKEYSSLSYNNFVKVINKLDDYVILSGNRVI